MSFKDYAQDVATRPGVELGGPEPQPGEAGPDPDGPWYGREVLLARRMKWPSPETVRVSSSGPPSRWNWWRCDKALCGGGGRASGGPVGRGGSIPPTRLRRPAGRRDRMSQGEVRGETDGACHCRNCSADLTDPKNAGFPFEGDWFCSGFCAEVCVGFWSRGETVEDYNAQLTDEGTGC